LKYIGLNLSLALALALFSAMLLTHLSFPLIWADEGDSVMFGQRVYHYGYPKVHDEKNTLYGLKERLEIGVDVRTDAYTGAPWVGYYVAAIGVALATQVEDIYEKTLRLRLPFTLLGAAGLAIFFLSIAPALPTVPGARRRAAVIFLLLSSASISLILHLREARYYPIVIFEYGILLYCFIHHHHYRKISYRRYLAISFATLFLLFNTFYPAFGVWCVGTTVYLGMRELRRKRPLKERLVQLSRLNAPVFLAALAVLPLLLYFDFALQVGRWFETWDSTIAVYARNLWVVLYNMLRFEFLAPAALMKALVYLGRPRSQDRGWPDSFRPQVETSRFLLTIIVCYWLVVARSPFLFERYFLTMGPLITIMLLVDGGLLYRLLRDPVSSRWQALHARRAAVMGPLVVVFVLVLGVRLPEIEGRLYEMRHQYKGPLDYFIPYILDRYENPEELVVATNYAEPVLMYYLGSSVTIGYYGADLERDMRIQPDVIVPRPWRRNSSALRRLAARVPYTVRKFEVENQATNNIPSLSPHTPGGFRHRFETVLATRPSRQLEVLERAPSEPR
jgi:hypothetical protein